MPERKTRFIIHAPGSVFDLAHVDRFLSSLKGGDKASFNGRNSITVILGSGPAFNLKSSLDAHRSMRCDRCSKLSIHEEAV